MEDLSLHILDIAENSITAGAGHITIVVREETARDLLTVEISDDGEGMPAAVVEQATDPFYTTRTTRKVGLGLALLNEAAVAANGTVNVRSTPHLGTTVTATFQLSHVDRKPLGRLADTITALIAARSDINVSYERERDGRSFAFDTREIRDRLDGLPLNSVRTLNFIRDYLSQEEEHIVSEQA